MSWSLIEDIEGVFARWKHKTLHKFVVSRFSVSGADVEYILRNYGIPLYLRNVIGDNVHFSVPESQATWSEYIMCGRGFAVATVLREKRHRVIYEKALRGEYTIPPAWGNGIKAKTFSGCMVDLIAGSMGYQRPTVPQRQKKQAASSSKAGFNWIPWAMGVGALILIILEQGGVL